MLDVVVKHADSILMCTLCGILLVVSYTINQTVIQFIEGLN